MIKDDAKATLETMERVMVYLRKKGKAVPSIKKILLFGSRARGDYRPLSDFDVAVVAPEMSPSDWAQFAIDVREECPTLCGVDILRLDEQTPEELLRNIMTEGSVVYVGE